jgi:Glucodextranase, domain B
MHDTLKSKLKITGLAILFMIILGYTWYRTKDLIVGVRLHVSGIVDYESRTDPHITLSGNALHATKLLINGRTIFITKGGDFTEDLLLLPGYNIIEVQATDKFGKSKEQVFHVNLAT